MKKLNEVEKIKTQLSEESRQAVLDDLITKQIETLEKMLENNGGYVKSPVAYNMCAGLIDQLKFYSIACFKDPSNLIPAEKDFRTLVEKQIYD